MSKLLFLPFVLILTSFGCRPDAQSQTTVAGATATADTSGYYQYKDGSRDGIGKFYQGREIAEEIGRAHV